MAALHIYATPVSAVVHHSAGHHSDLVSTTLGSVCDLQTGPGKIEEAPKAPTTPVVLPRSVRDNRIGDAETLAPTARTHERYRLNDGDIICTRIGQPPRFGLVRPHQAGWLLGPGCLRLRPGSEVVAGYLIHCLGSADTADWLDRHATGSAIRSLNARVVRDMPLLLPPIEEQRRTSVILRALDDEIELLERARVTTTELRAQAVELLLPG